MYAEFSMTSMRSVEEIFLSDLPDGMKLLPKDWNGNTIRFPITLTVSMLAIENVKFDVNDYLKKKFILSLKTIMKKKEMSELCLTHNFTVIMDDYREVGVRYYYFHVECAKKIKFNP